MFEHKKIELYLIFEFRNHKILNLKRRDIHIQILYIPQQTNDFIQRKGNKILFIFSSFLFFHLFSTKSYPNPNSQKRTLIIPFGGVPELWKSSKLCLIQNWWWFFNGTWSARPVHWQRSILGNNITLFLLFFSGFYSRMGKARDHEKVIIMTIFLTSLTIVGAQRRSTEGLRVCAGSKLWTQ